jgi:hypothetical protein
LLIDSISNAQQNLRAIVNYLREIGFKGATNYYHRKNSSLRYVMAKRKGIPITLSIFLQALCARLGIEVELVGFPSHFMVKFQGDSPLLIDFFHGNTHSCACACARNSHKGKMIEWSDVPLYAVNMVGMFDTSYTYTTNARDVMFRVIRNVSQLSGVIPEYVFACVNMVHVHPNFGSMLRVVQYVDMDIRYTLPQTRLAIAEAFKQRNEHLEEIENLVQFHGKLWKKGIWNADGEYGPAGSVLQSHLVYVVLGYNGKECIVIDSNSHKPKRNITLS